jgi:uncharacterized protein YdcH (DUF465 family)
MFPGSGVRSQIRSPLRRSRGIQVPGGSFRAIALLRCNFVPQRKGAASRPRLCVRGFCPRGDWLMFEQNPKEVEALMQSNAEFRSLYQRHKELDGKVRDAELGVLPMDDVTLHNMKKEKLHAKDKLTSMWAASH